MKTISLSCAALLICLVSCKAQTAEDGEFKTYNNGLIYDNTTMHQLTHIVDSLNLKFKRCDLTRPYYGIGQTNGHYVRLDTGNIKQARTDIQNNISFEEFISKYPDAKIDRDMLVTRTHYKDSYDNKWTVYFHGENLAERNNPSISMVNKPEYYAMSLKGRWVLYYSEAYSNMIKEHIEAFYFTDEFRSPKIPDKYARMILYSDCVIDTTEDIYIGKPNDYSDGFDESAKDDSRTKVYLFSHYLEEQTKHIKESDLPASCENK